MWVFHVKRLPGGGRGGRGVVRHRTLKRFCTIDLMAWFLLITIYSGAR
jgi:hypothetical protein